MAKKLKYVYLIWLATKYGIGVQPVKGDTLRQAKERFKKRFPKSKILDVQKTDEYTIIEPI